MNSFFSNLVGSQAPQPNINLYPLPHAVGIIPAFSNHQHTVLLRMREQLSFTGDDYTIDDASTGQPILRVTGKALSLRHRKTVMDAMGVPLFELRDALISLSRHWTAYRPGTEEVMFTVKAKMFSFKDAMTVTYTNRNTGREEQLFISGNWTARNAQIMLGAQGGPVVASLAREFAGVGATLLGQTSYVVSVAPGGDLAMMAALSICLDELAHKKE